MRADDLYKLPDNIAIPTDDHACDHLSGMTIPSIPLASTTGSPVDLSRIPERIVIYAYPRTGVPDKGPLVADWDQIPGARGCTPQSCSFRDHYDELTQLKVSVFGLSTQDTAYQREAMERLHLPFPLLSDINLSLATALKLPTFTVAHTILLKRFTLIINNSIIEKVFYPVFPPDKNAEEVLAWLSN